MKSIKQLIGSGLIGLALVSSSMFVSAADYDIDTKGAHAFIQFRIQHLGYSWLYGRFNEFSGEFSYDENKPADAKIEVAINTNSIDSNHAERDKHLRADDFLDTSKFPTAKFVSTKVEPGPNNTAKVTGNLTLKDVTKELVLDVHRVGMGNDPWGGYRAGFEGTTKFKLKDFNIMKNLGPLSQEVEMTLSVEGIRK